MWNINRPISRVHLTPPSNFTEQAYRKANWSNGHHTVQLGKEFDAYVALLQKLNIDVCLGEKAPPDNPDAIYSYDSCLLLPQGAIVFQSIKDNRQFEHELVKRDLLQHDIPIIDEIVYPCHIDGGDILWISPKEIAIGRSWRTNELAIQRLTARLESFGISVLAYDLTNLLGRTHCLHLMSVVSMLRSDTALIYEKGMPITLLRRFAHLGIETLAIADDEWHSLGCNVLSLGNGNVIAVNGNPKTKIKMENAGFKVYSINGEALCLAGEGGPTCLTRLMSPANKIK